MWIRKEAVIFDKDTETEQFDKETVDEKPLSWNEFRILQSTRTKDLATEYLGNKENFRRTGIKINRRQLVIMSEIYQYVIFHRSQASIVYTCSNVAALTTLPRAKICQYHVSQGHPW